MFCPARSLSTPVITMLLKSLHMKRKKGTLEILTKKQYFVVVTLSLKLGRVVGLLGCWVVGLHDAIHTFLFTRIVFSHFNINILNFYWAKIMLTLSIPGVRTMCTGHFYFTRHFYSFQRADLKFYEFQYFLLVVTSAKFSKNYLGCGNWFVMVTDNKPVTAN